MRRALLILGACLCAWGSQPAAARAQSPENERGRVEIAAGPVWTGRTSFGSQVASETTAGGSRFDLFSTSTELAAATGVESTIAVRLARPLEVVAAMSYNRPALRTEITGDAEGASPLTASESIQRIAVEGGFRWHFRNWAFGRAVPFLAGGAGYLRDLHEGSTLVTTGQTLSAGGGLSLGLTSGAGKLKAMGLRTETRVIIRRRGAGPDRLQTSPGLGVSVFFRF